MHRLHGIALAAMATFALAGCGGGSSSAGLNPSTQPGALLYNPPLRIASLNKADLTAQLGATGAGQQMLALAGAPKCGIDFHYFQYQTVGARGEPTTASGAIMAPNGAVADGCSGPRPILVYTHGTAVTRGYNIADPTNATNEAWDPSGSEGPIVAAFFAAQGYIVVASNYAGYDTSPLPYHPYLVGDQQSQDVINALAAARTAIRGGLPSGVSDNGKLFLTGYSQGGYVAMATYRAMKAANMTVTGVAPMSGPYAMEALVDSVVLGEVTLGSTIYLPLVVNAYQNAYGNLYTALTDIYSPTYATGIDTLVPGNYTFTTLVTAGKVPQLALFSSTPTGVPSLDALTSGITAASPLAALGYGNPYLVNNSVRIAYAADAFANPDHGLDVVPPFGSLAPWSGFSDFALPVTMPTYPLRQAAYKNDLRTNWAPAAPMLICAGKGDPEVPFVPNTVLFSNYWAPYISTVPFGTGVPNNYVTVLDVDPSPGGLEPAIAGIAAATAFADQGASKTAAQAAADVQAAVVAAYASHFSGATPIDPQGVEVAILASVASQAVALYYADAGNPTTMGTDILLATSAYYHFPTTQLACTVAAQAFFLGLQAVP